MEMTKINVGGTWKDARDTKTETTTSTLSSCPSCSSYCQSGCYGRCSASCTGGCSSVKVVVIQHVARDVLDVRLDVLVGVQTVVIQHVARNVRDAVRLVMAAALVVLVLVKDRIEHIRALYLDRLTLVARQTFRDPLIQDQRQVQPALHTVQLVSKVQSMVQ